MTFAVSVLIYLLVANALIAFGIAFYWHARVIFALLVASNWNGSLAPWKDLANPNGVNNTFGRFIAGEIFPELRPRWAKALGYVSVSVLTLFLVAGFVQIVAPEYLP